MEVVHEVEGKWICPVCESLRTFTQNHSLLSHIEKFHFDPDQARKIYQCEECKLGYSSKSALNRHMRTDHTND